MKKHARWHGRSRTRTYARNRLNKLLTTEKCQQCASVQPEALSEGKIVKVITQSLLHRRRVTHARARTRTGARNRTTARTRACTCARTSARTRTRVHTRARTRVHTRARYLRFTGGHVRTKATSRVRLLIGSRHVAHVTWRAFSMPDH